LFIFIHLLPKLVFHLALLFVVVPVVAVVAAVAAVAAVVAVVVAAVFIYIEFIPYFYMVKVEAVKQQIQVEVE
jgi:hypothetical protein